MKASVIVLAWNGMAYLQDCLDAVLAQEYPDFEVIVVDNASTDGSAEFVAARYPQARLLRQPQNLGFAGGNNVALSAATGEVLILLNQDTAVHPGWLRALVGALEADPSIGVAGAKALYPDGTIQHAGGQIGMRGEGSHIGWHQRDSGNFDRMLDMDYVTGASLAIRRTVVNRIGGLDEGFSPAYYEDVDWCYRARQAGFRVVVAPEATLVHREASLAAPPGYDLMLLVNRNRLRFVLKHWPLERLQREFAPAERAWLEGLREGAESMVAAVQRTYLYHLLHLDKVMASRQDTLGEPASQADAVAAVLIGLRTVVPLGPATRAPASAAGEAMAPVEAPTAAQAASQALSDMETAEALHRLRAAATLREHSFQSAVPVLGPLVVAFRRLWNRVSTQWYVRPLIQQQSQVNARVAEVLTRLLEVQAHQRNELDQRRNEISQQRYDQQRQGEVLAQYIRENGLELADLAQEIRRLRALLDRQDE